MARQFRPKRKPTPPSNGGAGSSGSGGGSGGGPGRHLDKNMVGQFKQAMQDSLGYRRMLGIGLSKEQHADVKETLTRNWLKQIGYKGTVAAAKNAGRKPPAESTYKTWVRNGRIPVAKADVAERVRRRAAIEALGGIDAATEKLGRSKSAIYAWRRGESDSFRGDETNKVVHKQQTLDTAKEMISKHAAVDPRKPKPKPEPPPGREPLPWEKDDSWSKPDEPDGEHDAPDEGAAAPEASAGGGSGGGGAGGPGAGYPQPRIQIKADVRIYGKGKEYELQEKELNLTTATWSEEEIEELILALEDEDMSKAVDLIERFATLDWANGTPWDTYDDNNGIHIEDVKSIKFWWGG